MRRSLVILLCILAAVLFYTLVFVPITDRHTEIIEELQISSNTLNKYKVFLETAAETEELMQTTAGQLDTMDTALIDVKNDAIGFARLNSYIQNIIRKSGIEIISIKPLNVVKYKLYSGLPLQINATADIKQLRDFIQKLSTGEYIISIDTMDVRVINIRKPDKVRIKIDVSGYREL